MTIQAVHQPRRGVGSIGPTTFNGLSALKVMGLDQGVYAIDSLRGVASTLQALQKATDPEIFSANLYLLARELEKRNNEDGAARLYRGLQLWAPDSNLGKLAAHRQAVINGQGSVGEKIERVFRGLLPALTDNANLASMYLGLRVFRGVSGGLMKWMGGTSWSQKALATGVAYLAEFPTFTFSHRAIRSLEGIPVHTPLKDDLIYNAKNLGALKVCGLAGAHVIAALGQRGIAHWAIPQTAMFAGVLGAQGLDVVDGTRPYQGMESLLTNAATTWLHFNMFGKVLGPLMPPETGSLTRKPSGPFLSPHLVAATPSGVAVRLPFAGKNSRPGANEFYSQGSEVESPSPPPSMPMSEPRASGVQPAGTLWYDSMKSSLGDITRKIYLEHFNKTGSDTWAADLGILNFQLIRETKSILHKTQREKPKSPDERYLRDIQQELEGIGMGLNELAKKNITLPREQVRNFLTLYSKFPNLFNNYIDGNAELNLAIIQLLPARQTLNFLKQFEKLPKGALLGEEQTSLYGDQMSEIVQGMEKVLVSFRKPDPKFFWALESSVGIQEFKNVLADLRMESEGRGHPLILFEELFGLQRDIQGLITDLNTLARDPSRLPPPELDREYLVGNLHQIPAHVADFIRESDFQSLIAARQLTRMSQRHLDNSLASFNDNL